MRKIMLSKYYLLVIIGLLLSVPVSVSAQATSTSSSIDGITWSLLDKEIVSTGERPATVNKILIGVDELPGREKLKATAMAVWRNGNSIWDRFVVFIFLPDMNVNDAAYYVAEFRRSGFEKDMIQDFALFGTRWRVEQQKAGEVQKGEGLRNYDISLDLEKLENRHLMIHVQTTFPDYTVLTCMVQRPYYQQKKDKKYFALIYRGTCLARNGGAEIDVLVNDFDWYNKCIERQNQFTGLDDFTGFRSITPVLEVMVYYDPTEQNSSVVIEKLGKNGENIDGTGIKTKEANRFGVQKNIEFHFEK